MNNLLPGLGPGPGLEDSVSTKDSLPPDSSFEKSLSDGQMIRKGYDLSMKCEYWVASMPEVRLVATGSSRRSIY